MKKLNIWDRAIDDTYYELSIFFSYFLYLFLV